MYSGQCFGGPFDGEWYAAHADHFQRTGYFDGKRLSKQAEERGGWSDRIPLRTIRYRWSAERKGWVPE